MGGWTFLLGGLIVWAVHFFSLYAIASIWLTSPLSRLLAIAVSLACLAADALLFARALRWLPPDEPDVWTRRTALLGLGMSAIAILWQALPAWLI